MFGEGGVLVVNVEVSVGWYFVWIRVFEEDIMMRSDFEG